jgi:hypothetical protein
MQRRRPLAETLYALPLVALIAFICACQPIPSKSSGTSTKNTPSPIAPASATTTARFSVVTVVQRSAQSDQVPVGKRGTVTASCEDGEQLLSGGYYVYAWEAAANVVASYPSALDSWTVTDDNSILT